MLQWRYFYNVGIMEPIMSTYHHMIMEELKGQGARRSRRYFKMWSIWPIVTTKGGPI